MNHDVGDCNVLGDYKLLRELGEANMSRYVLAVHELHRTAHTIRVMSKSLLSRSQEIRDLFYTELAALKRHVHPSIIPLREILEDDRCAYVVTTYLSGPPLSKIVSTKRTIWQLSNGESRARTLCHQIVNIALFLERHKISHWFKLENIIQASDDKLILLDFRSPHEDVTDLSDRDTLSLQSTHYRAPELLDTASYTAAGNAWACGVALYMLITGSLPFDAQPPERYIKEKICFESFTLPDSVSAGARDLICALLRKQPSTRLALRDIPRHSWFADGVLRQDDRSILFDMSSKLSSLVPSGRSRTEGTCGRRHSLYRTTGNGNRSNQMDLTSPPSFNPIYSPGNCPSGHIGVGRRPKSVTFEEPLPSALQSKRIAPRAGSTRASLRIIADAEHMRIARQIVEEEAGTTAQEPISNFGMNQNRRRPRDSLGAQQRKRVRREQTEPESPHWHPRRKRWTLEFRSPVSIRRFPSTGR